MKIGILTPCYSGNVNVHFAISLTATLRAVQNTEVIFLTDVGSSLIHMARNSLVARAMAAGCDKLFFIDDDVSWPINAFERVALAPATVCAGVYQKKMHSPNGRVEMAVSSLPEGLKPNMHGLCEVDGAATGFLRVDRKVFEDMKPNVVKIHEDGLSADENKEFFEYFSFGKLIKDGKTYVHGEDYTFSARARDAGHRIYIDPTVKLGHHAGGMRFDAALKQVDLL